MAKNTTPRHLTKDNTSWQAVCTKGDFYGNHETTKDAAEVDAAGHNAKPGCENHKVNIIQTTVKVKAFR